MCIQWGRIAPNTGSYGPFNFNLTGQYTQPPIVIARNSYHRNLKEGGPFDVTISTFKYDSQYGESSKVDFYWLSIGY